MLGIKNAGLNSYIINVETKSKINKEEKWEVEHSNNTKTDYKYLTYGFKIFRFHGFRILFLVNYD